MITAMADRIDLADPLALIDGLDADRIVERIEEVESQKEALQRLLRVARARERGRKVEDAGK